MKSKSLLLFLIPAVLFAGCIKKVAPKAPVAEKISHTTNIHGYELTDDYYWLRERGDEKVLNYLKAENVYTEATMEDTKSLQDDLFKEMVARIKETDCSVPEKDGEYFYCYRTEAGKQYKIFTRRKGSQESEENIILDVNILAEGKKYIDVGFQKVSNDGELLAYSIDTSGREIYTVYFKDLQSGELLDDVLIETYANLVWANDNKTVFYTVLDDALRPYQVYRHTLGALQKDDKLVFEELDDSYWLDISVSKSKKYIFVELGSSTTTEVHFLDADKPGDNFKMIQPREHKTEYYVYHHEGDFIIRTNDKAQNFKIMKTPIDKYGKKHWTDLVKHDTGVKIDNLDIFQNYMVVYQKENGFRQIKVVNFKDESIDFVEFPDPVYTFSTNSNPDYDCDKVRYTYNSLISPEAVYDFDMTDNSYEMLKEEEVLGGFDKSNYVTKRIYAEASDGTKIPITIAHRKDLKNGESAPVYLSGYGSYGYTSRPRFRSYRFSLMDRGFIFAIAHVRGSDIMGRYWYEDGKLLNKRNTFTDFIACGEHLIKEGYTSKDKLVISGGSAGGLLIGAVVNMRPDLFKAAIASVPFVDVINTMLDETIPLTVIEYEEWGNPNEKEYFDYMMSYSPYDNVAAQAYPNLLITAGLNDPRVQYWEPAKWCAKLRDFKTDDNLMILKTNMGSGHMGESGRYDYYKEIAFQYAFILKILDMN